MDCALQLVAFFSVHLSGCRLASFFIQLKALLQFNNENSKQSLLVKDPLTVPCYWSK